MRRVRICGGSGERNRKGRLPRALRQCPVSVVRRERRISQPALISRLRPWRIAVKGNNVPAPRRRLSPVIQKAAVQEKTAVPKTAALSSISFLKLFSQAIFLNSCFTAPCTLPRGFSGGGGVRSCLFLLVLPSIQTVLSAPDFHRFGLSCGRASLAESWRPVRMRRFVRFLPACGAVRGL